MDRIYYFMLTKEKSAPIFRNEAEGYEVYYLQVPESAGREELAAIQASMKKGIIRLAQCCGQEEDINCACMVYEGMFAAWLNARKQEHYWAKLWNLPVYKEYQEEHNLFLLLRQIEKRQFPGRLVILGQPPGMHNWISSLARYVKEISLFSLSVPREFEALQDKLLSEYGLMIRWERSLQPQSPDPALVLDYCDRENVFIWGIPAGSIWIDMNSLEARRHGLRDRETGIRYLSLQRFWREEMIQTIDTARKILYNTKVN